MSLLAGRTGAVEWAIDLFGFPVDTVHRHGEEDLDLCPFMSLYFRTGRWEDGWVGYVGVRS